jgi:hypothetical protein
MLRAGELEGLSPEESSERDWLLTAFGPAHNGLVSSVWERTIQDAT